MMTGDVSTHLASNIKRLRETHGLSQQKCSELSGVPRPTWANLETGQANPTLAVLVRVATALQVSLEDLIGAPQDAVQIYRAGSLPERKRSGVTVRRLVPDDFVGIEIDVVEVQPSGALKATAHKTGTREFVICNSGHLLVTVADEEAELGPGDVAAYRADQKRVYRAKGRQRVTGTRIVTPGSVPG
jgi:XRE family transcriptional regulator, regulator of sulfur utilization